MIVVGGNYAKIFNGKSFELIASVQAHSDTITGIGYLSIMILKDLNQKQNILQHVH